MRYLTLASAIVLLLATLSSRAEPDVAVAETLDAFHAAAAVADLDAYLSLTTEEVVFLGTDGSERWQGQAFRDFVQSNFEVGRGWVYTPVSRNVILAPDGNTAWFDEALRHKSLGRCRGSGVMVKSVPSLASEASTELKPLSRVIRSELGALATMLTSRPATRWPSFSS